MNQSGAADLLTRFSLQNTCKSYVAVNILALPIFPPLWATNSLQLPQIRKWWGNTEILQGRSQGKCIFPREVRKNWNFNSTGLLKGWKKNFHSLSFRWWLLDEWIMRTVIVSDKVGGKCSYKRRLEVLLSVTCFYLVNLTFEIKKSKKWFLW